MIKRFFAALLGAALLALPAALPAFAEVTSYASPGDYDEIKSYVVTVEPRVDGSADITYDIQWQVVGGGADDYLTWVQIGLANPHVDTLESLTPDTIASVAYSDDGGSYARVDFKDRYYAPAVAAQNGGQSSVHFAFRVHQSHLFTRNADNTATFAFTPGWFDNLWVDSLQLRWKSCAGISADNTGTDGDYLIWDFGPLDHGEKITVNVTVPVTFSAGYDDAAAYTEPEVLNTAEDDDLFGAIFVILMIVLVFWVIYLNRSAKWHGGLGSDESADGYIYYSNGAQTVHLLPGAPPPVGYHIVNAPHTSGYQAGGGSSRGGGASRSDHHTSCACACASSCACACACAGGGRAGCSAKNFYRVKMPTSNPKEVAPHEPGRSV